MKRFNYSDTKEKVVVSVNSPESIDKIISLEMKRFVKQSSLSSYRRGRAFALLKDYGKVKG